MRRVKTERISVLLFPEDKQELERLSVAHGEPMAVVVRRLIRQAAAGDSEAGRRQQWAGVAGDVRR